MSGSKSAAKQEESDGSTSVQQLPQEDKGGRPELDDGDKTDKTVDNIESEQ